MEGDVLECVYGVDDTMKVDMLIVWENLDIKRYTMRNSSDGEIFIIHLKKQQQEIISNNQNNHFPVESEVQEEMSLFELAFQ